MDLVPDDLYRRDVGGDLTAQHEAQRARRAAEEAAARRDAATRRADELQAALLAARAESGAEKRCAAAALIDGILASSRAERLAGTAEPVDTAAPVREVIDLLAEPGDVDVQLPQPKRAARSEP